MGKKFTRKPSWKIASLVAAVAIMVIGVSGLSFAQSPITVDPSTNFNSWTWVDIRWGHVVQTSKAIPLPGSDTAYAVHWNSVVRCLTNINTATPSDTEISIDSDSQHLYTWGGQAGSVIDFVANFATVTEYEISGVLNSTALLGHSVSAQITDIDTNATVLSVSVPNDLGSLTGTLQPGNYRILIQNRSHARGPYLWAGSIPYGPLNVNQDGNGTLHLGLIAAPLVKEVNIDVKPGSDKNPVNLKSQGVLPVAILSSADFDATQVDAATVTLGDPVVIDAGGQAVLASKSSIEDVDGDGLLDIVLFFDSAQLAYYAIDENSTAVELHGQTLNEDAIHGEDGISIVAGSTKGKGKK